MNERTNTTTTENVEQPNIIVLPDKYAPGHPKPSPPTWVIPPERMLIGGFPTDAHFVQYFTPLGRRLNRNSLKLGVFPTMVVRAFDVDCTEAHRNQTVPPDTWRANERAKIASLVQKHPGVHMYETRGGYRIVTRLRAQQVLQNTDDERAWSLTYLRACSYLARRFGIECDIACKDWGRLFRCPFVVRGDG